MCTSKFAVLFSRRRGRSVRDARVAELEEARQRWQADVWPSQRSNKIFQHEIIIISSTEKKKIESGLSLVDNL